MVDYCKSVELTVINTHLKRIKNTHKKGTERLCDINVYQVRNNNYKPSLSDDVNNGHSNFEVRPFCVYCKKVD